MTLHFYVTSNDVATGFNYLLTCIYLVTAMIANYLFFRRLDALALGLLRSYRAKHPLEYPEAITKGNELKYSEYFATGSAASSTAAGTGANGSFGGGARSSQLGGTTPFPAQLHHHHAQYTRASRTGSERPSDAAYGHEYGTAASSHCGNDSGDGSDGSDGGGDGAPSRHPPDGSARHKTSHRSLRSSTRSSVAGNANSQQPKKRRGPDRGGVNSSCQHLYRQPPTRRGAAGEGLGRAYPNSSFDYRFDNNNAVGSGGGGAVNSSGPSRGGFPVISSPTPARGGETEWTTDEGTVVVGSGSGGGTGQHQRLLGDSCNVSGLLLNRATTPHQQQGAYRGGGGGATGTRPRTGSHSAQPPARTPLMSVGGGGGASALFSSSSLATAGGGHLSAPGGGALQSADRRPRSFRDFYRAGTGTAGGTTQPPGEIDSNRSKQHHGAAFNSAAVPLRTASGEHHAQHHEGGAVMTHMSGPSSLPADVYNRHHSFALHSPQNQQQQQQNQQQPNSTFFPKGRADSAQSMTTMSTAHQHHDNDHPLDNASAYGTTPPTPPTPVVARSAVETGAAASATPLSPEGVSEGVSTDGGGGKAVRTCSQLMLLEGGGGGGGRASGVGGGSTGGSNGGSAHRLLPPQAHPHHHSGSSGGGGGASQQQQHLHHLGKLKRYHSVDCTTAAMALAASQNSSSSGGTAGGTSGGAGAAGVAGDTAGVTGPPFNPSSTSASSASPALDGTLGMLCDTIGLSSYATSAAASPRGPTSAVVGSDPSSAHAAGGGGSADPSQASQPQYHVPPPALVTRRASASASTSLFPNMVIPKPARYSSNGSFNFDSATAAAAVSGGDAAGHHHHGEEGAVGAGGDIDPDDYDAFFIAHCANARPGSGRRGGGGGGGGGSSTLRKKLSSLGAKGLPMPPPSRPGATDDHNAPYTSSSKKNNQNKKSDTLEGKGKGKRKTLRERPVQFPLYFDKGSYYHYAGYKAHRRGLDGMVALEEESAYYYGASRRSGDSGGNNVRNHSSNNNNNGSGLSLAGRGRNPSGDLALQVVGYGSPASRGGGVHDSSVVVIDGPPAASDALAAAAASSSGPAAWFGRELLASLLPDVPAKTEYDILYSQLRRRRSDKDIDHSGPIPKRDANAPPSLPNSDRSIPRSADGRAGGGGTAVVALSEELIRSREKARRQRRRAIALAYSQRVARAAAAALATRTRFGVPLPGANTSNANTAAATTKTTTNNVWTPSAIYDSSDDDVEDDDEDDPLVAADWRDAAVMRVALKLWDAAKARAAAEKAATGGGRDDEDTEQPATGKDSRRRSLPHRQGPCTDTDGNSSGSGGSELCDESSSSSSSGGGPQQSAAECSSLDDEERCFYNLYGGGFHTTANSHRGAAVRWDSVDDRMVEDDDDDNSQNSGNHDDDDGRSSRGDASTVVSLSRHSASNRSARSAHSSSAASSSHHHHHHHHGGRMNHHYHYPAVPHNAYYPRGHHHHRPTSGSGHSPRPNSTAAIVAALLAAEEERRRHQQQQRLQQQYHSHQPAHSDSVGAINSSLPSADCVLPASIGGSPNIGPGQGLGLGGGGGGGRGGGLLLLEGSPASPQNDALGAGAGASETSSGCAALQGGATLSNPDAARDAQRDARRRHRRAYRTAAMLQGALRLWRVELCRLRRLAKLQRQRFRQELAYALLTPRLILSDRPARFFLFLVVFLVSRAVNTLSSVLMAKRSIFSDANQDRNAQDLFFAVSTFLYYVMPLVLLHTFASILEGAETGRSTVAPRSTTMANRSHGGGSGSAGGAIHSVGPTPRPHQRLTINNRDSSHSSIGLPVGSSGHTLLGVTSYENSAATSPTLQDPPGHYRTSGTGTAVQTTGDGARTSGNLHEDPSATDLCDASTSADSGCCGGVLLALCCGRGDTHNEDLNDGDVYERLDNDDTKDHASSVKNRASSRHNNHNNSSNSVSRTPSNHNLGGTLRPSGASGRGGSGGGLLGVSSSTSLHDSDDPSRHLLSSQQRGGSGGVGGGMGGGGADASAGGMRKTQSSSSWVRRGVTAIFVAEIITYWLIVAVLAISEAGGNPSKALNQHIALNNTLEYWGVVASVLYVHLYLFSFFYFPWKIRSHYGSALNKVCFRIQGCSIAFVVCFTLRVFVILPQLQDRFASVIGGNWLIAVYMPLDLVPSCLTMYFLHMR